MLFLQKIMGGHENGGLEQNWGPVPPWPRPKTATGYIRSFSHTVYEFLENLKKNIGREETGN